MNLFVYGTLRKEGSLSSRMSSAKYLGTFKTAPIYKLWDCGCPCLDNEGTIAVTGEIYQCEDMSSFMPILTMEVNAGYTFGSVFIPNFPEDVFAFFQTPRDGMYKREIPYGDWIEYHKYILG